MSGNPRKRVFCPHCQEFVSRSTYHSHKQLYYSSQQWKKSGEFDVQFEFDPSKQQRHFDESKFGNKRKSFIL